MAIHSPRNFSSQNHAGMLLSAAIALFIIDVLTGIATPPEAPKAVPAAALTRAEFLTSAGAARPADAPGAADPEAHRRFIRAMISEGMAEHPLRLLK